ncbi:LacI family DNA-binding transcriptional regulator [Fimbriimonas ginsengisoli]|uniref:Putative LacI-family transcriptional regulator n=1 Tax=Fimbriimonas ginsengisoli Gsoil 348 TaxID=661478 RepID=A0A068NLV8_FIMGI|nr:LacI family DNA-binding transcriptional regulator [Fimbriimonas ginsengisoli]AIE84456.1 putative LacI-family transcriptional regulator [Fimbriimonas ginsengisoli Gsoil 348]
MSNASEKQTGRATLIEVATRAGVSATTASLVLSGKARSRRISADAHSRVQLAAEELNYAPNLLVRSLRRGRTHIVSFYNAFRTRESHDMYMDKLSAAVEYAGGTLGYDILVHCRFGRSPKETYEFLNGGLADGVLLFAPRLDDPMVALLRRSNLPVVLLNTRDPLREFPSVADDGLTGITSVAEALVGAGHRHIAAVSSEGPTVRDGNLRITRLKTELGRLGVDLPDEHIFDSGKDYVELVTRILNTAPQTTALFCWHDRLAYQVLEACEILKISIPSRLSIVGYDGLRWPSSTSHTAASVHVQLDLLAERGMHLLDQYIQGYQGPLLEESMPTLFDPGTTLRPPKQS